MDNRPVRVLFHILCLSFWTTIAIGSTADIGPLRTLSSEDLMEKGRYYVRETEHTDSALACFGIVAMRYQDQMDSKQKELCVRAMNNCGIIFTHSYIDYPQAYDYLIRAYDICEKNDLTEVKSLVYINLGNLFYQYQSAFSSISAKNKAEELYQKAYYTAFETEDWELFTRASLCLLNNEMDSVMGEMLFLDRIPAQTNSLDYARCVFKILEQMRNGNYDEAHRLIVQGMEEADSPWKPERDRMLLLDLQAQVFAKQMMMEESIETLKRLLQVATDHQQQDVEMEVCQKLSKVYASMGETAKSKESLMRYHEIKDSLATQHGLESIAELDFLYRIQEEEKELDLIRQQQQIERIWFVMSLVVLVLLTVIVILQIRTNRQQKYMYRQLYNKTQEVLKAEDLELRMRQKLQVEAPVDDEPLRYKSNKLSAENMASLAIKIRSVIDNPDIICDSEFSLAKLSQMVESNTSYVSRTINETYGMSFSILLGNCRVKTVCRRMSDLEHYGNLTIDGIAESAGFRTRASFISAFRRVTGMSPSEYQKLSYETINISKS